jgi:CRP-like cAMP-binding protein
VGSTQPPQPWSGLHATKRTVLQPQDFAVLRQHGRARQVAAGTVVAAAGSTVTHVQVVTTGELQLCARVDGRRTPALVVRAGGVITDIPLLLGAPMPYDAVTSQDSEIIRITSDRWVRMLTSSPDLCCAGCSRWQAGWTTTADDCSW